jgi:hypothetical protein
MKQKFRTFTILSLMVILLLMCAPKVFAGSIQSGADHILGIQNGDGSFTWAHGPGTAGPGHANITGPIGMGLIRAYGETGDSAHLAGATNAADYLVSKNSDWVGTFNPYFLLKTYDATGNTDYKDKAAGFFSELAAGTYTRQSVDYDTAGFISLIESNRSGSLINLRPWEFSTLAYAAQREGSLAQDIEFITSLTDGINTLDDAFNYDLLGLSGGVFGLGLTATEFDPSAGSFASASSTSDLADILAGFQNGNGAWSWDDSLKDVAGEEDSQTTAYAMLALMSVNTSGQYDSEIDAGRDYLFGTQLGSGGFPSYPGGTENIEVEGEVVWALSESTPVPEPTTVALLGIGLVGMAGAEVRRRRKKKTVDKS